MNRRPSNSHIVKSPIPLVLLITLDSVSSCSDSASQGFFGALMIDVQMLDGQMTDRQITVLSSLTKGSVAMLVLQQQCAHT